MSYLEAFFSLGHVHQQCEETQLLIDGARHLNPDDNHYQLLLDRKQEELDAKLSEIDFLIMTIAQQN